MAAQKNKPAPEEPSAKRRRLDTNGKAASSIKKKIASPGKPVGYKSKLNKGLEQRKKAQKASVKPTGSINKALKNPTQTKGTSNRSKQIKLEPKQNHKPKFNQKPSKNKHVGKVLGKKTVAKSNKVLSSKTAAQTSPGSQNIVSKSSRNNVPKVTRSPSRAISAKTERTTCKTTKGSVRSRTPARLRSAVNGRKGSPDTSSPRSSVLKSVKLLTKTGLRITHLENKPAKNDSRRNTAVKGSTPVTADSLHEINARKQSKRLERDALSNDATSSTIKSSDVNRVESRTAVVRKNVRSAVDSEAHENLKPHSKPKSVNKCASGKKPAKHVPKWKRTSRLELEGRRSQRLQQHSGLTVKSQQKRDMKKKVLKVTQNASVTQADWRRVKTEKHRVPKKKGQREGQASASRPSGPMTAKSKQKASKTTRKPKEIEQVLKSPPKKASKTNHKQAAGSSCPKSLLNSEGSSQQSPCEDAAETLPQLAAQESSCKQKKGKGPVLKKLKEKVVSKEEKLKAKAILKQKKMEAKAALKEQKLKEKAALKEKKLKEKVVSKEQKLKEKVARLKVKNKLKNKKSLGPQAAVIGTTCQSEMDPKSKRVSILELCEEIAGEIESDTVEVRKEVPDSACAIEATKAAEELLQQVEAESKKLTEEAMQNTPSKCFFPSKKTLHAKNRLNGKTSPIVDSKRKESRPVKASHVSRSNALNRAALPNLELLRRNILVPSKGNQARTTEVSLAPTDMDCPETRGRLLVAQLEEANQIHDSGKLEKVCLEGDWTKDALQIPGQLPVTQLATEPIPNLSLQEEMCLEEFGTEEVPLDKNGSKKRAAENELMMNKMILELEPALDESFSLRLDSSPESSPVKTIDGPSPPKQTKLDIGDWELEGPAPMEPVRHLFTDQAPENGERRVPLTNNSLAANSSVPLSEANLQKEVRKLKKAEQDGDNQLIIDAGQKRFGAMSCNVCGMLYTASNPEDETQHILFHNQFVSAVKYVGWKKERIVAEFPDGKIIMVFPDDPKYALRKVEEIREMVDYDLGFQQVPLRFHARTKTLLFISNDKKVVGCLIAEHIQWGYRVINEKMMSSKSEREKAIFESQKAWCCSTSPEPALCGISRIWVFRMMRRQKIASRMIECLRSNFIYGSYLSKEEIAFSDPTPDGKLFASQYCGTGQFLVYNFISGQPETT